MSKQKVLIVGGGFGGVKVALELAGDKNFEVALLSNQVDLRYYPTLYHTATGGQRVNSSIPLKNLLGNSGVRLIFGTAVSLDRKAKKIVTTDGQSLGYDKLVLSLGVVTNYFGIKGLEDYSFSIKSQSETERFKAHLHQQLTNDHRADLNYVIVGGGPTGIELAGALPEYLRRITDNHGLPRRKIHIDLVEAAPRLLPSLPRDTGRAVKRRLKKLGIRLYLGQAVQGETADELMVSGKPIRSHTVVWTAGVTNNPFFAANDFVITKHGKVAVDAYLRAEDDIYVIGDNANTPFSGMAQTALLDGKFIAHNLRRQAGGKQPESYNAKRPITIIPAGPRWAAVCWGGLRIYGWLGWSLREAADLIALHDYEPWPIAAKQWLSEFSREDGCQVCKDAQLR